MASGSLTAGKDLKINAARPLAWTTVPMHFSKKQRMAKAVEVEIRYTGIGEARCKLASRAMSTSQPRWEASCLEEVQALACIRKNTMWKMLRTTGLSLAVIA